MKKYLIDMILEPSKVSKALKYKSMEWCSLHKKNVYDDKSFILAVQQSRVICDKKNVSVLQ